MLRPLPFAREATLLQSAPNTLTMLTGGADSEKLSFFGGLPFSPVKPPNLAPNGIVIASFEDLYATKLAAVIEWSEAKDYLDIAALLAHGLSLAYGLGCARAFYGAHFNVAIPLKALVYYGDGDLASLPAPTRATLTAAVRDVRDVRQIPDVPRTEQRIGGR